MQKTDTAAAASKKFTISKKAGSYSETVQTTVQAKAGYKVYYTKNGSGITNGSTYNLINGSTTVATATAGQGSAGGMGGGMAPPSGGSAPGDMGGGMTPPSGGSAPGDMGGGMTPPSGGNPPGA